MSAFSARSLATTFCLAVLFSLTASSVRAADLATLDTSLKYVPIDASMYFSMLRVGEQYDAVVKSKAFRQLAELPVVKDAVDKIRKEWETDNNAEELREFLAREEVKAAMVLLPQMFSDEFFMYLDAKTARLMRLQQKVNTAQYRALMRMARGENAAEEPDENATLRAMFEAVMSQLDTLEMPTLVMGFKIRDKALANKQLARLEEILKPALEQDAATKGRLKRVAVAGDELLTFTLDGSMIPWGEYEEKLLKVQTKPGQVEALKKKLTPQTCTIALGVRSNYIVLSVAPAVEHLAVFGGPGLGAKSLAAQPLVKKLTPHADKPLTAIAYLSEAYTSSTGYTPQDIADLGKMIDEEAPWKNLPDNLELRVRSDVHELFQDLAWLMPKPQAVAACSFLTPTGVEGYSYMSGLPVGLDATQPLTLLEYAGPNPTFVSVSRKSKEWSLYPGTVKWGTILMGYFIDLGMEQVPEEQREKIEESMKVLKPIWARFDTVTRKKLIPSLADGQTAWVLGQFPVGEKRPTMMSLFPSPAMQWGVSDPKLLVESMTEYRAILEDFVAAARQLSPPGVELPPFKIPVPTAKATPAGTVYVFEIPLGENSEKLSLAAAVGPKVAILSLSPAHAEQMLVPKTLAGKGAVMDPKLPSASASRFELAELIDSVMPAFNLAMAFAPNDPETHQALQVVRALGDAAKVFRSSSSRTYLEDGATVIHGVTEIKDLP